jgi:hypothetical protein
LLYNVIIIYFTVEVIPNTRQKILEAGVINILVHHASMGTVTPYVEINQSDVMLKDLVSSLGTHPILLEISPIFQRNCKNIQRNVERRHCWSEGMLAR